MVAALPFLLYILILLMSPTMSMMSMTHKAQLQ